MQSFQLTSTPYGVLRKDWRLETGFRACFLPYGFLKWIFGFHRNDLVCWTQDSAPLICRGLAGAILEALAACSLVV